MRHSGSGNYNTAVGFMSSEKGLGSHGCSLGAYSLYNTTTGSENTAVGSAAGKYCTTGSNNIFIGKNAGKGCGVSDSQKLYIHSGPESEQLGGYGYGTTGPLIGGDFSARQVYINGELRVSGDITAYVSSDKRLKNNLEKINDPLDKLNKINGYTFDWIEKEGVHSNKGHDIGVIAQEIEEVLPEIVVTRENGYKAVRYEKIVPLLIETIKEQQKQINKLNDRLEILENKVNS